MIHYPELRFGAYKPKCFLRLIELGLPHQVIAPDVHVLLQKMRFNFSIKKSSMQSCRPFPHELQPLKVIFLEQPEQESKALKFVKRQPLLPRTMVFITSIFLRSFCIPGSSVFKESYHMQNDLVGYLIHGCRDEDVFFGTS
jgi:hypothetical protein